MSFWYKDHSTPNPLGVLPDPAITKIVVGDKFSDEGSFNGALKLNVILCKQELMLLNVTKLKK